MIVTGYITYKPLVQRFHFHETIVRQEKGDLQKYEFLELPNSLKTVGEVVTHVKTKLNIDMDLKFCFEKSLLRPDLSTEVFRTAKADVFVSPYPLPAMSTFEAAVQSMSFVNEDPGVSSPIRLQESDESKDSETTRSSIYETLDEETISAVEVSVDSEDDVSGQSSMKGLEEISVGSFQHVTAQIDCTTKSTPKPAKRRLSFTDCLLGSSPVSEISPKVFKMSEDIEMTPSNLGKREDTPFLPRSFEKMPFQFSFTIMESPTFVPVQSPDEITSGSWIKFAEKSADGTKGPSQDYRVLSEVKDGSFCAIAAGEDGSFRIGGYRDHAKMVDLTEIHDIVIASDK